MAVVKMSLIFAFAGPFMHFCAGEHMRRHREPLPSGGFLSASSFENRKGLRDVVSYALGSISISTNRGARGDVASLSAALDTMWQSLAKNEHGRIDHRSLRYAIHRYLLKTHGLSVVGLEPTVAKDPNEDAYFLQTHAPLLVKEALEGAAAGEGFSKDDAIAMILMLEHFVWLSSEPHLSDVFRLWGADPDSAVPVQKNTLRKIMESRFFELILGGDDEGIRLIRENSTLVQDFFEDWEILVSFVHGHIESYQHALQKRSLATSFTYDDALAIAGDMSLSMGAYWETECARVQRLLADMDPSGTGRIRLADFHNAASNGEWRFSESKEYLRHIGALDETSTLLGPRIILANYVQGPSNCIVSTNSFRICCMNDCESHLGVIEAAVKAPSAEPELILAVVSNISSHDDERTSISTKMRNQLFDIAKVHKGVVPLHGRLFAQWLHYVFPRECVYPHKSGTTGTMSFFEFGEESLASTREIEMHAAMARKATPSVNETRLIAGGAEEDWLSQWSHEEELIANQVVFQAPWTPSTSKIMSFFGCLVLAVSVYATTFASPEALVSEIVKVLHPSWRKTSWDAHAHII